MLAERTERLARFCQGRGRANLRIVVGYDDEEYVVAHVRDDVRTRYTADDIAGFVDVARAVHGDLSTPALGESPLGPPNATVHYFDDAVVVHLFVGPEQGYLASFDREASPTLVEFVDECRLRVGG